MRNTRYIQTCARDAAEALCTASAAITAMGAERAPTELESMNIYIETIKAAARGLQRNALYSIQKRIHPEAYPIDVS